MTFQPAPAATVAAICVSLLICIGLPVALFIILRVKTKARVLPFFLGCGCFVLFAMLLEGAVHRLVLGGPLGSAISGRPWLYALYGGFMAALFEETGRYIFLRLALKKDQKPQNALMFGAGHGGIEAILITGLAYITNLSYVMILNAGQAEQTLAALEPSAAAAMEQAFTALAATPSYLFLLAGLERLLAITLHIELSLFVYTAIRRKQVKFLLMAFALHMLVDSLTVVIAQYSSPIVIELTVLVEVLVIGLFAVKLYRQAKTETGAPPQEPPAADAPAQAPEEG